MIDKSKLNAVESCHMMLCFIITVLLLLLLFGNWIFGNILQSEIGPLQISLLWDNKNIFLYVFFS